MVEVFALEQQAHPEVVAEPPALGQRGRAACVVAQQAVELGPELRIAPRRPERPLELGARGYQRLGDEATTEPPEATFSCGLAHDASGHR